MKFIKFIFSIILIFYFSAANADQNDKRLDDLFLILSKSQNEIEIQKTTTNIWKIWMEVNDPVIQNNFNKGLEFMKSGQIMMSIEIFSQVIENNPSFAEAWNKRATAYYIIGDFDSSFVDIEKTLRLEPRHFGAMDGLGLIYIHLEKYNQAIEIYDEILKILPNSNSIIRRREEISNFVIQSI